MLLFPFIVTEQVGPVEEPPSQPVHEIVALGSFAAAVKMTVLDAAKLAAHVPELVVQLMPPGLLVTVPLPCPMATLRV